MPPAPPAGSPADPPPASASAVSPSATLLGGAHAAGRRHLGDELVGVVAHDDPRGDLQGTHVELVADLERGDVVGDRGGDVARFRLDRDREEQLLEEAAALDTLGVTLEVERHVGRDRLVGPHPHEVDVHQRALQRVALHLAGHRELLGAVDAERDHGVGPAGERELELVRVDRDRDVLAVEPVDDGRHAARAAEPARGALAGVGSAVGGQRDVGHGASGPRDGNGNRRLSRISGDGPNRGGERPSDTAARVQGAVRGCRRRRARSPSGPRTRRRSPRPRAARSTGPAGRRSASPTGSARCW
ncbi:MAG: hypothetical protein KatS3mg010_0161 [Acidimicrobiia bacterium]|nr:MAG: hypothetical protein KatS3mg010_0161 [Acidimicrobiia bacterium]